ncbi:MAG: GAF domain-containing protein, partial [Chloroflexota bacterium]
ALKDGLPFIIHDFLALEQPTPGQRMMLAEDIRSYLTVPMRRGGELIGLLGLASGSPDVFRIEHVQIAQEVADSLAVMIQNARLHRAAQQRQRETEVMRDVMAALASAGDLKGTLEALLVHLHGLIHYDRAGLFLVDENQRFAPAERHDPTAAAGEPGAAETYPAVFPENDPLVAELRRLGRPLVVGDARADPRFAQWPELRKMRGWLGAPLLAGGEMLGFLSLGSLRRSAYSPEDAATMAMFAEQVSQVLQRAWLGEQSQRRTEELEVLSSISSALGQAERDENTLAAIVEQLTRFLGAARGLFLSPAPAGGALVAQASSPGELTGLSLVEDGGWLEAALERGQPATLGDTAEFLRQHPARLYERAFAGAQSALAIPLAADEITFGLLLFAFEARRRFTAPDLSLFRTVAELAAASLRRAVMLEALEKQVSLRTQHLTTLYHINALASEPRNLLALLEDILYVTVASMSGTAGTVHFLEQDERLSLAAQNGLPSEQLPGLEALPAGLPFWQAVLASQSPLVVAELDGEAGAPEALRRAGGAVGPAYLAAPIRAKNQALGVLSLFGRTIQDYSIEDITLFMTVADQIGSLMERSRLIKQAEVAAVVQERQRLARELHDSVTQLLYSQALFSGAALKVLRKGDQGLAEQHLARIEQAAQQALKEMRLLVYELRPSDELDEGLVGALERRLNAVEKRTGINARLVHDPLPRLPHSLEMGLYRIAEEALNNTLKHAHAATVGVWLLCDGQALRLEVADDGRGFDPQVGGSAGGMGLANIHERAAALGGQVQILSAPGQGTRVLVDVQLGANRRER